MYFHKTTNNQYPQGFYLSDIRLFAIGIKHFAAGGGQIDILYRQINWNVIFSLPLSAPSRESAITVLAKVQQTLFGVSTKSSDAMVDILKSKFSESEKKKIEEPRDEDEVETHDYKEAKINEEVEKEILDDNGASSGEATIEAEKKEETEDVQTEKE